MPDPDQTLRQAIARHQNGDFPSAIDAYQQVLQLQPDNLGALANLASALKQAGRPDEALVRYQQALAIDQTLPQLWFNFANLLQAQNRPEEAERAFRQALAADPAMYVAHFNLARLLQAQKRLADAEPHYREAVRLQPDFARGYSNLGNLLRARGQAEAAVEQHRIAVRLAPQQAGYWLNLGNALMDAKACREAAEAFHRALDLAPGRSAVRVNFGNALAAAGDKLAAEQCYRTVLAAEPDSLPATLALARFLADDDRAGEAEQLLQEGEPRHPEAAELPRLLGEIHYHGKRYRQAIECWRRALKIEPECVNDWNMLGAALQSLGDTDAARAALEKALALAPDDARVHCNLGTLHQNLKQPEQAVAEFRRALALDPDEPMALTGLAFTLLDVGLASEALALLEPHLQRQPDHFEGHMALGNARVLQARIDAALEAYRRAHEIDPDNHAAISNLLFASLYNDRLDAATITDWHRDWSGRIAAPVAAPRPAMPVDSEQWTVDSGQCIGRALRVGYLSPDLRAHPVGFFMEPILAHHDPERVEIFCYLLPCFTDPMTERLKQLAPQWHDCRGWDDARLVRQIEADGIDLLVDLAGHTAGNRMPLLARKPASRQALYLGYPCTSGLAAMDALIGDRRVTPPHQATLYSERLFALEHHCFLCFRPPYDAPEVASPPVLENGFITFGCFNNLAKVSATALGLWSQLLERIPDARLVLKALSFTDPGTRDLFREKLEALGVAPKRVDLLPPTTPKSRFLEEYRRIDIALDPFPYHGGTTSCEALWMGVPLISRVGAHFFSRMGLSILSSVGLPELAAESDEAYIATAAELAADIDRLQTLRAEQRPRLLASSLCDEAGFTAELEGIYRRICEVDALAIR